MTDAEELTTDFELVEALTEREKRFCEEYIIDTVGANAARKAGYSQKTASQIAWSLLQRPHIQKYIDHLNHNRSLRTQITADRVLKELARIAFFDVRDVVNIENGGMIIKDFSELSEDDAAVIKEVSQNITESGGTVTVKFNDKLAALEKLGKHLKLFTDVNELKFSFTQMGRVNVTDADGAVKALSFNVGQEPDKLEGSEDDDQRDID